MHSMCPEHSENFSRRNLLFFDPVRNLSQNFSGFRQKISGTAVKTAFYESRGTFPEKLGFLEGILIFFQHFRILS